jgi:hypothetical protein
MAMNTLSSLEQQLASLKAATAQPVVPVAPSSIPTLDDIRDMVKEMLVKELGGIVQTLPQVPKAEPIVSMEDALSSILTGDEIKWLMNPENVKKLPLYMMSEKGKPLTQQYIKEFRSTHES